MMMNYDKEISKIYGNGGMRKLFMGLYNTITRTEMFTGMDKQGKNGGR